MGCISLREYDIIRPHSSGGDVPDVCFEWLKKTALARQKLADKEFVKIVSRGGDEALQVRNYVGLLQTPDGTCIEIFPKSSSGVFEREAAVKLLLKMLGKVYDLSALEATAADLGVRKQPLIEILISLFLMRVAKLVHKGIRSDYSRIKDRKTFLKGRLRVAQQLRQPVSKQHTFCIEYDQFLPDRPENRLIRSALETILKWTKSTVNQKLARELHFSFFDIPQSTNYSVDMNRWSNQRDMIYYRPVLPWVSLILTNHTPWFMRSSWHGMSLLFPMEQLYERYLGKVFKRQVSKGYTLREQAGSHYLTTHKDEGWFRLRPDFVVSKKNQPIAILDAKWKLLDSTKRNRREKYGLSQADFYQLFAYGQKYLANGGDLFLVYPLHEHFKHPLSVFTFGERHKLWIVPFDLQEDCLMLHPGLRRADWLPNAN